MYIYLHRVNRIGSLGAIYKTARIFRYFISFFLFLQLLASSFTFSQKAASCPRYRRANISKNPCPSSYCRECFLPVVSRFETRRPEVCTADRITKDMYDKEIRNADRSLSFFCSILCKTCAYNVTVQFFKKYIFFNYCIRISVRIHALHIS